MRKWLLALALILITASIAFAGGDLGRYSVVKIDKGQAITNCDDNPRLKKGTYIILFKYGVPLRYATTANNGVGKDCKVFPLKRTEGLKDGLYIGFWKWNMGRIRELDRKAAILDNKEQADLEAKAKKMLKAHPKAKAGMQLKHFSPFRIKSKIFASAQLYREAGGNVQYTNFIMELSPKPKVIKADYVAGSKGSVPSSYLLDVIDTDIDKLPEIIMVSLVESEGESKGEIEVLDIDEQGNIKSLGTGKINFKY